MHQKVYARHHQLRFAIPMYGRNVESRGWRTWAGFTTTTGNPAAARLAANTLSKPPDGDRHEQADVPFALPQIQCAHFDH